MQLLRPVNPLWLRAADMLAAMPLRILVLIPLLAGLVLWRPEMLELPAAWSLALFVPSVLLAWLLGYLAQAALGCLAFWLEQSDGLARIWFGAWMLFSGYLAPLALFSRLGAPRPHLPAVPQHAGRTRRTARGHWPIDVFRGPVRWVLTAIVPVALITSFPAQALQGAWSVETLLTSALVCAAFLIGSRMLWQRALASYTSASS